MRDAVLGEAEQLVLAVGELDVAETDAPQSLGVLTLDGDHDLGLVGVAGRAFALAMTLATTPDEGLIDLDRHTVTAE